MDTSERKSGLGGEKEAQRQVNLRISLMKIKYTNLGNFFTSFLKFSFLETDNLQNHFSLEVLISLFGETS